MEDESGQKRPVTADDVRSIIETEASKCDQTDSSAMAKSILIDMIFGQQEAFIDFLTTHAYANIIEPKAKAILGGQS